MAKPCAARSLAVAAVTLGFAGVAGMWPSPARAQGNPQGQTFVPIAAAPAPPPDQGGLPSVPPPPVGPPEPAASGEAPAAATGEPPQDTAATPVVTTERFLPRLDVFFPEGDLDLRVSRLVNKVFFEGQVKYNFVNGDITAFLRYRYYGLNRTTQLAVFDSISFQQVQKLSNEFDRVRGGLLFFEWPHDYGRRAFALVELDRISSNRTDELITNNRTNTFVRAGYQLGSPGDGRSEAIVGETRAHVQTLFTVVREIGPGDVSLTTSLTYGLKLGLGNFDYLKLESEGLKRFDLSERTFIIGRVHEGSFLYSQVIAPAAALPVERFAIPLSEYFNLGGRDNLKGVSSNLVGTEEVHSTWELFSPWFLGAHRDFLHLEWQNWYWILYTGAGTIGFDTDAFGKFRDYAADAGFGFESSVRLSQYRFFLSGIVARALKGQGRKLALSVLVRSYR